VQHGRDIRMEFLAKMYFALLAGPEAALELIEKQKTACFEWLSVFQNDEMNTNDEQVYERLVFNYRAMQIQATIEWLEMTRKEIGVQLQHEKQK
jgi:hypothetical protein